MEPIVYPELPYNAVICRYNEIATKGRNRRQFEDLLIRSVRRSLAELGRLRVLRERGRLFVRRADRDAGFEARDCRVLRERIPQITGLASASPGFLAAPEPEAVERAILDSFPQVYAAFAAQVPDPAPIRYCMRARRNNKSFPLTSTELEIQYAERFLATHPRLKVDLEHGDLRVEVEIRRERAFVSYERISGPGGLPAGVEGRVTSLLSGGIDSPVACFQMMKRGCSLDFITFHSPPYTPPAFLGKAAKLVRMLNAYQAPGRLVAVNLLSAQKEIRDACLERYRTVLYRRMMVRLATAAARAFGAKALATGDNIGQVASQTLTNLTVVSAATDLPILRPLLTYDKFETVALARRLGTFEVSQEPAPDSCTVFAPRSPATAADLVRVRREEARLDLPTLLRDCVADARLVDLDTLAQESVPGLEEALEAGLAEGRFET